MAHVWITLTFHLQMPSLLVDIIWTLQSKLLLPMFKILTLLQVAIANINHSSPVNRDKPKEHLHQLNEEADSNQSQLVLTVETLDTVDSDNKLPHNKATNNRPHIRALLSLNTAVTTKMHKVDTTPQVLHQFQS
jgi:hypothetical protein